MSSSTEKGLNEILDNGDVWEGQCWTIKKGKEDPGWPTSLVVVQVRGFLLGNLLTVTTQPVRKAGYFFPIRADVLLEHYDLEYDHATHLGLRDAQLSAAYLTLQAIQESKATEADTLRAMAALHLKNYPYE